MIDGKICPLSIQSGHPNKCLGAECGAYRQFSEDVYGTDFNGKPTKTSTVVSVCRMIPGVCS